MSELPERCLTIREEGIMLGTTVLAEFAKGELQVDDAKILALLSVAYGYVPAADILRKFQRAGKAYKAGEKVLALMHLALTGLPALKNRGQVRELALAEEFLSGGGTLPVLLRHAGIESILDDAHALYLYKLVAKFNPNHIPAGSPEGGQFTTADSARGGERTQEAQVAALNPAELLPVLTIGEIAVGTAILHNTKPVHLNNDTTEEDSRSQSSSDDKENNNARPAASDIIAPGGKLIGEPGKGPDVQVIEGQGIKGAEELFGRLTEGQGGKDVTPLGYKGKMIELSSGDRIGIRPTSNNGEPAVDVNIDDGKGGRIRTRFKFP